MHKDKGRWYNDRVKTATNSRTSKLCTLLVVCSLRDRLRLLRAAQRENVLVTRTFSKLFGMAGLRAGYAFGHRSIFQQLRPFQVGPLNLNTIGLVAAAASLDDVEFQERSREMAARSRTTISTELKRLGFHVYDSDAACLWVEWDRPTGPLVKSLADRGILIAGGLRWQAPKAMRISIATKEQTDRLLTEISGLVH